MNKKDTKLTVVMPSYNRGDYIEQAIQSVLMQKVSFKYELIIADDCSQDQTLSIVREYAHKYGDKITVMESSQNQGLLANCIRVYKNMKTDYFCVLDADDYWIDDCFLQKAYDFLENNKEYVMYGGNTKIQKNDMLLEKPYHENCKTEMSVKSIYEALHTKKKYITNTSETIFRNVIFSRGVPVYMEKAVGGLDEASYRGDTDRYMMHLQYGFAKFVNEIYGVYRQHERGIWSSATEFHRKMLLARAYFDYSKLYFPICQEDFRKCSCESMIMATAELMHAVMTGENFSIEEQDIKNYTFLFNEYIFNSNKTQMHYDLIDIIRNVDKKKIYIWGTGSAAKRLVEKYIGYDKVENFVDNDKKRWGDYIEEIKVISPEDLKKSYEQKYVLIASSYYDEILSQIKEDDICYIDDIVNLYELDFKYSLLFR